MKEIKAYVRETMAHRVIDALGAVADLDFSILDVRGISSNLPRETVRFSVNLGEVFVKMVKFEIVCRDENADRLVGVIRGAASTGRKGDGVIFVADIEQAVRIATGESGPDVLSL